MGGLFLSRLVWLYAVGLCGVGKGMTKQDSLPLAALTVLIVIMYLVPTLGGFPTWPGGDHYSKIGQYSYTADLATFELGYRPIRAFITQELSEGRLPLWLPTQMLGIPLFEQFEYQLLNPLEWLNWIGSDRWWSIVLCLYLIFAGLGIFKLSMLFCTNRWAATGGAVAYVVAGYTPWFYTTTSFITAVPVIPWLMYFITRAISERMSPGVFAGLWASFMLMLVCGQPQITLCTFYFVAFFAAAYILIKLNQDLAFSPVFPGILLILAAAVLAGLSAGPQLVQTGKLFLSGEVLSNHPLEAGPYVASWRLQIANLMNVFFPYSLGVSANNVWTAAPSIRPASAEEFPLAFYATGGFLALVGIINSVKSKSAVYLAVATTAAFLAGTILLQAYTAIEVWRFNWINLARYCAPVASAIGSLLIAAGLEAMKGASRSVICIAGAAVVTCGIILVAVLFWRLNAADITSREMLTHSIFLSSISLLAMGMIAALFLIKGPSDAVLLASTLLFTADAIFQFRYGFALGGDSIRLIPFAVLVFGALAVVFDRSSIPYLATASLMAIGFWAWHSVSQVLPRPFPAASHFAKLGDLFRGHRIATSIQGLMPNLGAEWGITTISARMPLQSAIMQDYLRVVAGMDTSIAILDFHGFSDSGDGNRASWASVCLNRRAYNVLAIELLAEYGGDLQKILQDPECSRGMIPISNDMQLSVFRDIQAAPPAYMAHGCMPVLATVGAQTALLAIKANLDTAISAPIVEGPSPSQCGPSDGEITPLPINRVSPREVLLDLTGVKPGLAVLNDAYNENWVAYIDGSRAPIYRTNALMRGVVIPQQAKTLRFIYEPEKGILIFIFLSAASPGLLILLMFAMRDFRKSIRTALPRI
jgi:hypothetical protein